MNVCVFSCGKKLWILSPGVSGRVWAAGSGSGFCLRVLNILIFVFRSVQTEQISRRDLAPDKLIKKKQTSRVLKKSLDPDKKQVFLANIRILERRKSETGCLENTSETSSSLSSGRQRLITKPAFIVIPWFVIHEIIVKADFGYDSSQKFNILLISLFI